MCNPRRVEVRASRQLAESWEHEVRRLAALTGTAAAEVRIREELDADIGQPTLAALVSVLDGHDEWELADGAYRYRLADGYVAYHVEDQELEIVVQLSDEVSAEAEASVTMGGRLDETITATGTGRYYDDGWGGITEDDARQAAERDVEQRLEARTRERAAEVAAAAESAHDEAVRALAEERAAADLATRVAERSRALRAEALARLSAAGIEARNAFNQALALAFRDAIVAYARAHGASGLICTDEGGVVDIQFEITSSA
jgi:hypothetical protein